jgi:hypothetical protein
MTMTLWGEAFTVSAFSGQPSAIKLSAVSHQPSADS